MELIGRGVGRLWAHCLLQIHASECETRAFAQDGKIYF